MRMCNVAHVSSRREHSQDTAVSSPPALLRGGVLSGSCAAGARSPYPREVLGC